MSGKYGNQNYVRDNVAAELTEAVYPVVLRHGVGTQWLDLELNLWKALTEALTAFDAQSSK